MRRKKVSRKIPVRAHKRRVTSKMRIRRKVSRKGSRKVRMRGGSYNGKRGEEAKADFIRDRGQAKWLRLSQQDKDQIMLG